MAISFEPSAKQQEIALREQMKLQEELWDVIERNASRWEGDEEMTDMMISGVLMATVTTLSGSMLAMVSNAMGISEDGVKAGMEVMRKGALVTALALMENKGDDEKDKASRH